MSLILDLTIVFEYNNRRNRTRKLQETKTMLEGLSDVTLYVFCSVLKGSQARQFCLRRTRSIPISHLLGKWISHCAA